MRWNGLLRFGAGGIVAWAALAGAAASMGGGVGLGGSGSDGTPPSSACAYETKPNSGSSECKRSGRCGQIDCCYAEFTIPPHDVLVPGTKRIASVHEVPGILTQRRCDPPVYFFGFLFGGYDCEIEHQMEQGDFFRYVLETCPPEQENSSNSRSDES